jgi:hypothetical protein
MKKLFITIVILVTILVGVAYATIQLIQLRGDTAANWTSYNPTLHAREVGIETDTLKLKIGDGSSAWNSLSYVTSDYPKFSVGATFPQIFVTASTTTTVTSTVQFTNKAFPGYDTSSAFTTTVYTVPKTGVYHLSTCVPLEGGVGGIISGFIQLYQNNTSLGIAGAAQFQNNIYPCLSTEVTATIGDKFRIDATVAGFGGTLSTSAVARFSGYYVP